MEITVTKEMFDTLGSKEWKPYGINEETVRWKSCSVRLTTTSNEKVRKLLELLTPHNGKVKGARAAIADLKVWIEAATKGTETKCKTCKHFASLSFEYIQKIPRHWLYTKDDDRDVWAAWYVSAIHYHEKEYTRGGGVIPAHTDLKLYQVELGSTDEHTIQFHDDDCRGLTAPEILREAGWIAETTDLAETYKRDMERYIAFHDKVGKQFFATGLGTSNLDGNDRDEDHWWYGMKRIAMDKLGERARIVIDVVQEGDKKEREKAIYINWSYWRGKSYLTAKDDEDDDDVGPDTQDSDEELAASKTSFDDLPLFPVVPVFDLRRHMRLRVHIANLTEYVYDHKLGEKLVLPKAERDLVDMLVAHQGGFRDIIGGKGGGAIVLCCGIPGTGKTLTSEVYAEVMSKALYSVQCSQLGTDEEELEEELLKVFARAQRWGAILLLDEADVYVAARGSDLRQNAIVGVFLRVLEYYQGVLFMTTNRADLVDDAIASRCLARVEYKAPSVEDQKKIWNILSSTMGVRLEQDVVEEFASRHPGIVGRDIKNLLKLSSLVANAKNEPVTVELLEFVSRFKPTGEALHVQAPHKSEGETCRYTVIPVTKVEAMRERFVAQQRK